MNEPCPRTVSKKQCGGELKRVSQRRMGDSGEGELDEAYRKEIFKCQRCGQYVKRIYSWQYLQDYEIPVK